MSNTRQIIEQSGEFAKPGDADYRPDTDGQFTGDWAEYADPKASGVTNGVFNTERGLPWHVKLARLLGQEELMQGVTGDLTVERLIELLPVQMSDVEAQKVYAGRKGQQFKGKVGLVRSGDGLPLGIVSPRYKVVQPRTMGAFGAAVLGQPDLGPTIDSFVELRDGNVQLLNIKLDALTFEVPGDNSEVDTYLGITNSYDGSFQFEALITQVRRICKNTQRLARESALSHYRIRHTGDPMAKIAEATKALGVAVKATKEFEALANRLVLREVVDDQVQDIFRRAWNWNDELTDGRKERHNATRAFENYLNSETIPDGIRGTGWGAFQAATEFIDHEYDWKGKSRSAEDLRAVEVLVGAGQAKKERILRELLKV